MPHMFSCFGTAVAFHGVSRPAATSVPSRVRQHREISAGTGWSAASSASGSSPAAPDAAASKLPPSIWLQPPDTLVRGSSDVVASPELSSVTQLEAGKAHTAKANPRGSQVQQKSPVTREASRRLVPRRYSVQSRSEEPARFEDSPSQVAYALDEGCARDGRGSNTSTSREPRRQRLGERQLPVFPVGGRAPAEVTTSGGEAVEASREYDMDFHQPEGSDIHTEDVRKHQGSSASAANGGTTARDGGSGRKSWQTGQAGGQTPSLRSPPPTEGAAGGRRMFWGKRSFSEDAEDQYSSKYVAEEDAAGCRDTADGPCDDRGGTNLPGSSHRRRRRSSTGRSSLVHEKPQPTILVKPCIWIAPQFPVEGWTAGGAGASEAVPPVQQAPDAVAGGKAAAVSLRTYLDGAVLTSSETCVRGLRSLESPGKDTLVGVGGSSGAATTTGLRGSRNVGLIRKVPWRPRGHHKRSSAVRFFAKRVFWLFCYFAVADLFMSALSTASDLIFQHNPQPKLRDRFHDWVLGGTPPSGLAQTVTDCLTVSLLVVTLLRHLLFVQLPLNLVIICRYFFLMATTYWLRGIAIFLTTIPSSVPNCKVRPVYSASDFVANVVLASTFQLPQCTDMIISGHTLTTCLCVATWLFYNNCNKDEAEMRRAPFHILVRWLLRYRRSATVEQERGSCSPPAGAETVGHRRHLQPRQQQPEQRVKKRSILDSQVFNGDDMLTQGVCAAADGSPFEKENKENYPCTASLGGQYRSSVKTQQEEETSSRCGGNLCDGCQVCNTSSDTVHIHGPPVAGGVDQKEGLKLLSVADGKDELQYEEEAARAAGEGTAGEKEDGHDMEAERPASRAITSRAVLRNEAVLGAAAAVTETFVAAAAVAGGVFLTAAVPAGRSFPLARVEGSTISVSETAASFLDGTACAANTAGAIPFGACSGEGGSPSAASAALCAAFAAAAVVEEDERKSSTHLQEMEDFSGAGVDRTAASTAEPQVTSTDNEDHMGLKTQMATVEKQGAREIPCPAEDCLCLLTDRTDSGKGATGSKRMDSELPGPYHIFRRPPTLGQERPDFSYQSAPVMRDEKSDFTGSQAAGFQREEAGGVTSTFASACCSVRAAVAAADSEKVRDDGSSVSQCTAGAGSCSSSEEDDGMRALLAPHQSRRHHAEKENVSQFSCCAMPPGLSTFFAAAHNSVARGPAAEEEAAASSVVPVGEAAAADEEKTTGGRGGSSKNRCHGIRAQKEEELERMGQHGSGKRRAGRGRGDLRSQAAAPGSSTRAGFAQCCSKCLSGMRRRLLALLGWACAWNLLGTWCILQAAANIIIIDASFCHYTVDIFFGVIFSFGCFTFYHMIVCLLWAARTQDDAGAADIGEGYYAVVRLPAARIYRRRGSCYRNPNNGDIFDTIHPCARAAGAGRELPGLFSPCRRRAARSAAGTRLRVTEAAGPTAATTGPRGGMPQAIVGIQKFYAERGLGGRGRKATEVGKGTDLSERGNDESGLPKRETVTSVVGGSTAVTLSVMKEIDGNACHTETASNPARTGGGTCINRAAPVGDVSQFANGDTAGIAASTASVKGDAELLVTNALSEDKKTEKGLGSCSKEDRLQLLAYPDQRQREEFAELAAVQHQEIGGLSPGGDRSLQPTVPHLHERPADAVFTSLEEARQPRPPLWDRLEGATDDAMEQLNSASNFSVQAGKRDGSGGAGGAAPDEVCNRGTRAAAGTAQREALGETQKTARSSEDIGAEGVIGRRHRVLHVVERTISGESRANVAADIAISILRFPLVRCAAYFIARLEGLELP